MRMRRSTYVSYGAWLPASQALCSAPVVLVDLDLSCPAARCQIPQAPDISGRVGRPIPI